MVIYTVSIVIAVLLYRSVWRLKYLLVYPFFFVFPVHPIDIAINQSVAINLKCELPQKQLIWVTSNDEVHTNHIFKYCKDY